MIRQIATPEMAAAESVPLYIQVFAPDLADEMYADALSWYDTSLEAGGQTARGGIDVYDEDPVRIVSQTTYNGLRRVLAYRSAGMTPRREDEALTNMLDNDIENGELRCL